MYLFGSLRTVLNDLQNHYSSESYVESHKVQLVLWDKSYDLQLFSTKVSTARLKVTADVPVNKLYVPRTLMRIVFLYVDSETKHPVLPQYVGHA